MQKDLNIEGAESVWRVPEVGRKGTKSGWRVQEGRMGTRSGWEVPEMVVMVCKCPHLSYMHSPCI